MPGSLHKVGPLRIGSSTLAAAPAGGGQGGPQGAGCVLEPVTSPLWSLTCRGWAGVTQVMNSHYAVPA